MFDETFTVLDEEMSDRMKYAKKNKNKLLKSKKDEDQGPLENWFMSLKTARKK